MSMKAFVPDSVFRWRLRGAGLLLLAAWMVTTYILMCHPPLVMNTGAVALALIGISDLLTAHRHHIWNTAICDTAEVDV